MYIQINVALLFLSKKRKISTQSASWLTVNIIFTEFYVKSLDTGVKMYYIIGVNISTRAH